MDDIDRYLPPWTADLARARRQTIGILLARTALKFGAKLAVVHRDTRRTFAELDADANRVANALAERGVVRNERVAIYSHNSYAFVVAYFALARLGAISVPVNFNFVASEVRYVLEDSGSTAAIVEDALVDTLGAAEVALSLGVVIGHRPGWTSFDRLLEHDDATQPDVEIGDDDPVQLLYTSGTTSAAQGRDHDQPQPDRPVRQRHRRRRVPPRRRRAARAAALPLRGPARLPHARRLPRRHQRHRGRPTRSDPAHRRAEGSPRCSARPRCGSGSCARRPSTARPVVAAQGLLRRGDHAGPSSRSWATLPASACSTTTARPSSPNATVLFPEEQIAKAGTAGARA